MLKTGCAIVLLAFLAMGCATQEEATRRYFWPPLPDTPRIEFVASYWSEDDFPKKGTKKFLETVSGLKAAAGFNKPWGIASDGEGKVFIADTNLKAVVIFDIKNQTVDALGSDEGAPLFKAPVGVALDAEGNIYVSDPPKNKVLVFTKDKRALIAIGNDTNLQWPVGMAVDNNLRRLYVVNARNHNIAVFDLNGKYLFSVGGRGEGEGEFNFPTDVAVDSKGNLVIADSMNARIQILAHDGKFIRKFGQRGDGPSEFQIIKGVAVSRDDNIYVTDAKSDKMLLFNSKGDPLTVVGGTANIALNMKLSPGGFLLPQDVYIDKNDTVYVVDSMNKRFQVFQIINDDWLKMHPLK